MITEIRNIGIQYLIAESCFGISGCVLMRPVFFLPVHDFKHYP